MIFAFERLAGISSSCFRFRFYNDICFQDPSWYSSDGLGHKIVDKSSSADGLGHEIVGKNSSADGLGA